MKYVLNILITFSFYVSFAQAPGHLGKRFILGYGAHVSPAFNNPNFNNETIIGHLGGIGSADNGALAFNYTHEGYIEYATSSRFMVGLSAKFYKTKYDNAIDAYQSNGNSNVRYFTDVRGYYDIYGQSIALYGKLYGSRYVAPWGRYIIFGPVVNLYSTSYDPSVMFVEGLDYSSNNNYGTKIKKSNFGPQKQNFTGFNILFGWGRSRIIANRLVLDYGVNMQVLSMLSTFPDEFKKDKIENGIETRYIEGTSGIRIRGLNRINAFLKVGFLIF